MAATIHRRADCIAPEPVSQCPKTQESRQFTDASASLCTCLTDPMVMDVPSSSLIPTPLPAPPRPLPHVYPLPFTPPSHPRFGKDASCPLQNVQEVKAVLTWSASKLRSHCDGICGHFAASAWPHLVQRAVSQSPTLNCLRQAIHLKARNPHGGDRPDQYSLAMVRCREIFSLH